MQATRPVFLDLRQIRLPITGIVSILHRVSGILMVLAIPAAAILLHEALSGPAGFAAAGTFLGSWPIRLALLVLTWSLLHHLFAGIRFLLLDLGCGLGLDAARTSAFAAIVAGAVTTLAVLALGFGVAP
jgi:succinate dehydrogenase / fumarate reductase cytochrome b subunit